MTIYINPEFKCHTTNPDGTFREFDVEFFNGKCLAFIEGYYYVPPGEVRIGEDGSEFRGEQITPWVDSSTLDSAQQDYEQLVAQNTDMKAALDVLEVEPE